MLFRSPFTVFILVTLHSVPVTDLHILHTCPTRYRWWEYICRCCSVAGWCSLRSSSHVYRTSFALLRPLRYHLHLTTLVYTTPHLAPHLFTTTFYCLFYTHEGYTRCHYCTHARSYDAFHLRLRYGIPLHTYYRSALHYLRVTLRSRFTYHFWKVVR